MQWTVSSCGLHWIEKNEYAFVVVFLSEFVLLFAQWTVSSGGLHWIGAALQPHILCIFNSISVFLSEFVLIFVLSGGLHWIGKNIYVLSLYFCLNLC